MEFFVVGSFLDALVVDWDNYSFKYASFEEDREGTLKRIKKVLTNYWTYPVADIKINSRALPIIPHNIWHMFISLFIHTSIYFSLIDLFYLLMNLFVCSFALCLFVFLSLPSENGWRLRCVQGTSTRAQYDDS